MLKCIKFSTKLFFLWKAIKNAFNKSEHLEHLGFYAINVYIFFTSIFIYLFLCDVCQRIKQYDFYDSFYLYKNVYLLHFFAISLWIENYCLFFFSFYIIFSQLIFVFVLFTKIIHTIPNAWFLFFGCCVRQNGTSFSLFQLIFSFSVEQLQF